MFCLCTASNPELLKEKLGGLSLLHRALLTLWSAGIQNAVFPLSLKEDIQNLAHKDERLQNLKIVYEMGSVPKSYFEWNLDWVVWPQLFTEFVQNVGEQNKILMQGTVESGLRFHGAAASQSYVTHHSTNPVWPLMRVSHKKDFAPLLSAFYKALKKPTDGFISRNLNRPVSIFVSSYLVRWGVSPSFMTTFCIVLTVLAALLALSFNPWHLALAGLLFHLASTLDGCDGEIARLTFSGTEFGAWYDTLGDNARYGFFFACLGLRAYQSTGNSFYVWALAFFVPLMIYFVWLNARYLIATKSGGTFLVMATKVVKEGKASTSLWDKIITPLQPLTKLDVQAFVVMLMCFAGFSNVMFCFSLIGIVFMTLSTIRSVEREEKKLGEKITNHWAFFFLLMGSLVLVFLFLKIPFAEIIHAITNLGWSILWVFALAPVWYLFNAFTLKVLTRGQVGMGALFFNHLVGESYNNILPLAGLAGEPFKLRHLSKYLGAPAAVKVVVQDKLLNALAGIFLIFVTGWISYLFLPLNHLWKSGILLTTLILSLVFGVFSFLTLSHKPRLWVQKMIQHFGFQRTIHIEHLEWNVFLPAFMFRVLGRLVGVLEVALLMYLLGLPVNMSELCFLSFMVSASGLIFFMVPQGIGVNEAGLTAAFRLLSWSTPTALALGLLRRARIVGWALIGLIIHMLEGYFVFRQKRSPQVEASKI